MKKPKPGEVRKPTKTISGITPVAVMLPPRRCKHGSCIYCPNLNVPQSYTPKSPVVMRAMGVKYDAYRQVRDRLKAFKAMNHPTDKIELIIMGGTFLEYPEKFQNEFIKSCYDGLNGDESCRVTESQEKNETAKHRCVALCIETRPDVCIKHIEKMRNWGVTRVELGVQIIDDKIYKKVKRGHIVQDVVDATKELKDAGFKIGYHVMPGLPGSDMKKDLQLFKKLFSDPNFKPDQLKLYPCQVMPGSELEKMYWEKKYVPYTKEQIEKIIVGMLKVVPRYCRVMRIMREIPPEYLVAGTIRIDLRKDIENELRKKKNKLKEIRYREVGFALRDLNASTTPTTTPKAVDLDLKLKITKYKASKGNEYFLEIVNKDDILFGLLRLRMFNESVATIQPHLLHQARLDNNNSHKASIVNSKRASQFNDINKRAIIREIHVYGQALKLGHTKKSEIFGATKSQNQQDFVGKGKIIQHKGIGKWLMNEAEKIAKQEKARELAVISGIGVREYYKKLGYGLKSTYMVKKL